MSWKIGFQVTFVSFFFNFRQIYENQIKNLIEEGFKEKFSSLIQNRDHLEDKVSYNHVTTFQSNLHI